MGGDMSNSALGRFLSLEFLGMLLIGGIAWGTLSADVDNHGTTHKIEITEIKADQKEMGAVVHDNQKVLIRLEESQNHFSDALERTERKQEAIWDGQQKILRILESQYPAPTSGR